MVPDPTHLQQLAVLGVDGLHNELTQRLSAGGGLLELGLLLQWTTKEVLKGGLHRRARDHHTEPTSHPLKHTSHTHLQQTPHVLEHTSHVLEHTPHVLEHTSHALEHTTLRMFKDTINASTQNASVAHTEGTC